ncbi:MAG TPA: class II aldolase/adducin family protein [bacterium]|nr:class II aldolase/adducin family protein [bacterium]
MLLEGLRTEVLDAAIQCYKTNLIQGTAGNISARDRKTGYVLITPTGMRYETLTPADVVVLDVQGTVVDGGRKPSSETPMHTAVYRACAHVMGIAHTHSIFATTFACLGRAIPPVHYLIAVAGGSVPVAEYATYGTPEMGANALRAIGKGKAVLLRNHGVLTIGGSVGEAVNVAATVEYIAQIAYQALLLGTPEPLPEGEISRLITKLATHGQPAPSRA